MARTILNMYQSVYNKLRNDGLNHEDAMDAFPQALRTVINEHIQQSGIEVKYGVTGKIVLLVSCSFLLGMLTSFLLSVCV